MLELTWFLLLEINIVNAIDKYSTNSVFVIVRIFSYSEAGFELVLSFGFDVKGVVAMT